MLGNRVDSLIMRLAMTVRSQSFWERVHYVALRGMNIGGGDRFESSGELWVMEHVKKRLPAGVRPVIFDVGANVGSYARHLLDCFGRGIDLYCFEPSRATFDRLGETLKDFSDVKRIRCGLGDAQEELTLYTDATASGLASVYPRRLDFLDIHMDKSETIPIRTLDDFCRQENVRHIHFLKMDVEGNKLKVLHGAKEMLATGAIDFIQFEFGGCNIDSHTFLKDFYFLLDRDYALHRVLKDGLAPIPGYKESLEIFATTNFLAVSRRLR